MSSENNGPTYDRQLLLYGAKRNAMLELSEVRRYGTESWGDSDYVQIYGLTPTEWYAKGIRILGQDAVHISAFSQMAACG